MSVVLSAITIGIDPTIEIGPVTVAWHGVTIAIGIVIGGCVAALEARRRGLDSEPIYAVGMIVVAAALVGGRAFYLLEHGQLDNPGDWFGTTGFTFYGGFIVAALGIAYYVRRNGLSASYLDAIAGALPLGLAVGRIGDVINGEHYGAATDFFLGVRNSHPDALTPDPEIAYHSGGLYEVLIASSWRCSRSALLRVLPALRLGRPRARPRDRPVDQPPGHCLRGRRRVAHARSIPRQRRPSGQ